MIDWCVAEIPEREVCGAFVGTAVPAVLFLSLDNKRFRRVMTLPEPATIGYVTKWPEVEIKHGAQLRSIPEPGDENLLYACGQLISFGDAELVGPGRYRLDRIMYGLRGTSGEMQSGGQVMLLDSGVGWLPLHGMTVGRTLHCKMVPDGEEPPSIKARPLPVQGLSAPRVDGTRPSVKGMLAVRPDRAEWGDRFIVGKAGAVWAWLDRWVEEPVEVGQVVYVESDGSRRMWDGSGWSRLPW